MPTAYVTCGPASEPVDAVRCLTNFSTGELGTVLSERLAAAGWTVVCFRGSLATFRAPAGVDVVEFSTNESLLAALHRTGGAPDAVFHAAALCDFSVAEISGVDPAAKLRSDAKEIHLVLRPAPKVLPLLRAEFPRAWIIGWKYELDGTREDAVARARRQIASARTDACVVNGSAYGEGFGLVREGSDIVHLADKQALAIRLEAEFAITRL